MPRLRPPVRVLVPAAAALVLGAAATFAAQRPGAEGASPSPAEQADKPRPREPRPRPRAEPPAEPIPVDRAVAFPADI